MNQDIIGAYLLYSIVSIVASWTMYLFLSICTDTSQLDKDHTTKKGLLTYIIVSLPISGVAFVMILIVIEITVSFYKYWNELEDE